MGMPIGASRGFSTPVSMPVTQQPVAQKPAKANVAAAEQQILLNTQGPRGTVVNTKA